MKDKLRILHCRSDVGGMAWGVSDGLKSLGHKSEVMVYQSSWIGYEFDYNLHLEKDKLKIFSFLKALGFFVKSLFKYDIYNFYFGATFFTSYFFPHFPFELVILRLLRKKVFIWYQGSELRPNPKKESGYTIRHKQNHFDRLSKLANATFVLNPDLLNYSPDSILMPYAHINLAEWTASPKVRFMPEDREIQIIHAPTNREIKGTKYIVNACNSLKNKGYKIKLNLVEKKTNKELKKIALESDIAIDQLIIGWYGGFSVEMMALKKPVICYINFDDLVRAPFAKDLPIISATTSDIEEKIESLLNNRKLIKELGEKGREYVLKVHDNKKFAQRLVDKYNSY